MIPSTSTHESWKQKLSDTSYRALTEGVFEVPGTGAYVRTQRSGTYLCRGCGTPLFASTSKIDDGSGFATFTDPIDEKLVPLVTAYTEAGDPITGIRCASCDGRLGFMDDISLQSSDDLEQGVREQVYHVSSYAVRLKKALSVRNYPIIFALGMLLVGIVAYASWTWGTTLLGVSSLERTDATIPLWLGEVEVRAVVVRLDQPQASTSGMVVRQDEALLFVLGDTGVPGIRFANHSVDILWLDKNFMVVGWERERASQSSQALKRPQHAQYGLIAQLGTIAPQAFATGFEVVVTDKTSLF